MNNLIFAISKFASNFVLSNGAGGVSNLEDAQTAESGIWSVLGNIVNFLWIQIKSLLEMVLDTILSLMYLVTEFMLKMLDLIYVFFKELAGMNYTANLLDANEVMNSDLVFQFLSSDVVRQTTLRVFVLAIVLLILFSIVAIIKSEYTAAVTDGNNAKKQILVGSLRSIFLMILVPIICIGGIVLSNTVLTSVSSAFTGSDNINLGSTVFLSSAYQANMYREYAESDLLIPITYELSEINAEELKKLPVQGTKNEIEKDFEAIATAPAWNTGLVTYNYFVNRDFYSRGEIPNSYYITFDRRLNPKGNDFNKDSYKTENDYTNKLDYYVMADLQDTFVKYNVPFYFIKCDGNLTVKYKGGLVSTYKVTPGAMKEVDGAVFTIAIRPTEVHVAADGSVTEKLSDEYTPIVSNTKIYYYKVFDKDGEIDEARSKFLNFDSDYLEEESGVLAKGIMSKEGYPTTIKQTEDGTIVCYRDYINAPVLADIFPQITYEEDPDFAESTASKFLKVGVQTLTGLDPSDLIPYVYFRFDIWTLFQKSEDAVCAFSKGESLTLSYMFNDKTGVGNHYNLRTINWVVFVLVSSSLLGILLKSCFGLVMRVFDIVVLMLVYPVVASVIPLDGGERTKQWNNQFISRLFAAYGIVISLNFVFLLMPLVEGLDLIDQSMLTGVFAYMSAPFINFLVKMAFMLVLFTFIKSGISIVSKLFGEDEKKNPINAYLIGESNLAKVIGKRDPYTGKLKGGLMGDVREHVSGEKLQEKISLVFGDKRNINNRVQGWLPGSVFMDAIRDKRARNQQKQSLENFTNVLKSGNTDQIQAQTDAHDKHADSMNRQSVANVKKVEKDSPYNFER